MEQNSGKQILYWIGIIAILVFAYSAYLYAATYADSSASAASRSFGVTAEGRATAKNDIAQFTYSVTVQGGKDIGKIKEESDKKTKQIQDFLKAQGVDAKDIQTVIYNLEPRYQYYSCNSTESSVPCKPAEIVGYTLNQTDSVKIRNLENVEKIVSGALNNGANTVSQLNFTVDDPSALQSQAKAQAVSKAIEQAKIIAEAGHFKIGKILSIDEIGSVPVPMYRAEGTGGVSMKSLNAPASDASLEAGSQDITSNITVRFEIR